MKIAILISLTLFQFLISSQAIACEFCEKAAAAAGKKAGASGAQTTSTLQPSRGVALSGPLGIKGNVVVKGSAFSANFFSPKAEVDEEKEPVRGRALRQSNDDGEIAVVDGIYQ